jgi:Cu2+-exporting ATPase
MAFTLPRYFGLPRETDTGMLCDLIAFASASLAVLAGGSYFFVRAWRALRSRVLHIDLPIAIGVAAAYAGSIWGWITGNEALFYYDFVATFLFLMLTGRWVQEQAVARAQRRTHEDQFIPAEHRSLAPGDAYPLAPGAIVPVESRLLDTATSYSLEWITGEPDSISAQPNAVLPAGARLLGNQAQRLEARQRFDESTLAQLLGAREAGVDRLLQRVLGIYISVVMLLAAAGGLFWAWHGSAAQALQVVVSVLVVSCPCGLGVSLPLLNARCTRHLESFGLVIRNLSIWSRLGRVRQIVFDKTGTLTLPSPKLVNPDTLDALNEEARNQLHALVRSNRHPFARSLDEAMASCAAPDQEADVVETPGAGVSLRDALGCTWVLGKPEFVSNGPGGSENLCFGRNGQVLASFRFEEAIRPDATEELSRLRKFAPRIAILSGDRPERVREIARQIGLPEADAHGGMSPQGKAQWLREHQEFPALFIGDGANDSLAVDEASCSGTPVTGPSILEPKADFHFFGRGLQSIRALFETERQRRHILRRIFTFAIAYNLAAIGVCLTGHMSPLVAAVVMPLSSLVSIGTASSRFRKGK